MYVVYPHNYFQEDCPYCRDCQDCQDCRDCRDCQDCQDCRDYRDINNTSKENYPSYAEFKNFEEYEKRDPYDYIKSLLCCESWKCKCEAKLYCEITSRLTYELCIAKNLYQTKEIIDSICCLFSADSEKGNSLAKLIKSLWYIL